MIHIDNDQLPSSPPKKRKLKHPRTARACAFCRRRKVRCTGTQPCDYCQNEGVRCEYSDGLVRSSPATPRQSSQSESQSLTVSGHSSTRTGHHAAVVDRPGYEVSNVPPPSKSVSLDPPQTFAQGQHIGPSAGVSFLYHIWNRSGTAEEEVSLPTAPLTCHGDAPQPPINMNQPLPTREEAITLVERYFQFAVPTYRFLLRPSTERWISQLLDGAQLSKAETACALIVCSQALLYTTVGDRYQNGGDEGLNRSRAYFDKAKSLLNQEPGPATLVSVQARLAMCLYLLGTFRINECRFSFSFVCTVLISIGLQRKPLPSSKFDLVTLESRKRTFWSAYVLDGYLSVFLGQPRLLHDADIDQEYPRNIDDNDLLPSESLDDLPLHGNLEAFIAHAELSKLMGRNNQLLYPLQPLTEEDVLARTYQMLSALDAWRDSLPEFLKPRDKTLTGQRTFERQNTTLKLAYAHLRILVTRRCLLADFSHLGRRGPSEGHRALKPIEECIAAVCTILDTIPVLNEKGTIYQAFWFQSYVALVGISTLYVFLIQRSRSRYLEQAFDRVDIYLDKARYCQDFLAKLAPEGSQSRRHHELLNRLRDRAVKDATRAKKAVAADGDNLANALRNTVDTETPEQQVSVSTDQAVRGGISDLIHPLNSEKVGQATGAGGYDGTMDAVIGQFTPAEDDFMFQDLNGWGWESLDTGGFFGDGDSFSI
ncbi:hypothetical protein PV08_00882 [Exophiala spinifera]|uniref:Zn(2)-C6 fungal-type domain-containing protein n=1 Tax=Exophiala spinifera TaxID=91928 RepID=A0A0D2A689_9EURO|nr:uncharacterized protein PV08_00882 [Exophiala spinifera]KIW20307.1 hypothetical protein PV08_00882 [Exophiala spinifera]